MLLNSGADDTVQAVLQLLQRLVGQRFIYQKESDTSWPLWDCKVMNRTVRYCMESMI